MSEQHDHNLHLEHHLTANTTNNPDLTTATVPNNLDLSRDSKTTQRKNKEASALHNPASSSVNRTTPLPTRRSARISLNAPGTNPSDEAPATAGSASTPSASGKRKAHTAHEEALVFGTK